MRTFQYISLALLTAFSLMACEKVADVELPEVDPKLAISCFIAPQKESIYVSVRLSNPIFGDASEYDSFSQQEGCTVTLASADASNVIPWQFDLYVYQINTIDFPIIPGETYTLTVTHPEHGTVTATTTVPLSAPEVQLFDMISVDTIPDQFGGTLRYNQKVDINGSGTQTTYFTYDVYEDRLVLGFDGVPNTYTNKVSRYYHEIDESDPNSVAWTSELYYGGDFEEVVSVNYKLIASSVSEEYFLYHKTVENISIGDPFSEPTLVYSNVNGGLGVFAAYNYVEVID